MRIFFAWYDCWVGWYIDRDDRRLYICPLPMLVLRFNLPNRGSDSEHACIKMIELAERLDAKDERVMANYLQELHESNTRRRGGAA